MDKITVECSKFRTMMKEIKPYIEHGRTFEVSYSDGWWKAVSQGRA